MRGGPERASDLFWSSDVDESPLVVLASECLVPRIADGLRQPAFPWTSGSQPPSDSVVRTMLANAQRRRDESNFERGRQQGRADRQPEINRLKARVRDLSERANRPTDCPQSPEVEVDLPCPPCRNCAGAADEDDEGCEPFIESAREDSLRTCRAEYERKLTRPPPSVPCDQSGPGPCERSCGGEASGSPRCAELERRWAELEELLECPISRKR